MIDLKRLRLCEKETCRKDVWVALNHQTSLEPIMPIKEERRRIK